MQQHEQICPLCQLQNGCLLNEPHNCWCMKVTFDEALLKQLPEDAKGNYCICKSCLETFNKKK